jgi:dTDP-4-dehydrorhamnose 3,5-epimerase
MNVIQTDLPGVLIIEPRVFGDERGFFMETWQQQRYAEAGMPERFVQDNISFSRHGILRGLHYQNPQGQGKLVYVLQGEVYDVAVDIRAGSPNFGRAVEITLSAENKRQFYVPPGFAHGFCVTSDAALFVYKCTEFYNPAQEGSVRWDDPQIGIDWPVREPLLSDKDKGASLLSEIPQDKLPQYPLP